MVAGGFTVCPPLYTWGQVVAAEQYDLEEGCWKLCGQEQGLCLCHCVVATTCAGGQNGVAHEVTCTPAEAYIADGHAHLSHHHMCTPAQTPGLDCCPFASVRILPIHPQLVSTCRSRFGSPLPLPIIHALVVRHYMCSMPHWRCGIHQTTFHGKGKLVRGLWKCSSSLLSGQLHGNKQWENRETKSSYVGEWRCDS